MDNVKLIDGTIETISNYADIVELIREKLSPDIAELLGDKNGFYNYEESYVELNKLYDELQEDNTYEKTMESKDIDEVKSNYENLYSEVFCIL